MVKHLTGAALGLALLSFSVGCVSPTARRLEQLHVRYAEDSVQHNLTMDCLEEWDRGAQTSYNLSETDRASGRRARPSDYLTLPPGILNNCLWGGSRQEYRR
jgi:hypothetical protein